MRYAKERQGSVVGKLRLSLDMRCACVIEIDLSDFFAQYSLENDIVLSLNSWFYGKQ